MKTNLAAALLLTSSIHLFACGGYGVEPEYTVHEWGTFTSLQGADGVQFEWRPQIGNDLPKFVHSYLSGNSSDAGAASQYALGKGVQLARQRMETPVLYFYSPQAMRVDVRVDFPEGVMTEWFPRVSRFAPVLGGVQPAPGENKTLPSFIEWKNVHVMNAKATAKLPMDADRPRNHYYAAREVDANPLSFGSGEKLEQEKLLFYRGLGRFNAPLEVTIDATETLVTMKNSGKSPLAHLHVLAVKQGRGAFLRLPRLNPGETKQVALSALDRTQAMGSFTDELATSLNDSLIKEGLYALEARAMVNTWRDAWFQETGLRVLYTLPRDWTAEVLPLKLSPQPKEVVRVMVGRAELITPSIQRTLSEQVDRFARHDEAGRKQAVAVVKALDLGRFLEPFLSHAIGRNAPKPRAEAKHALWQAASRSGNASAPFVGAE